MQSLRIYCDVARHHSFSQAATVHGITQSAASQRVGQLEKRLGVKLIDRSVRPLALTPAGAEFLHGAQELLERYDQLEGCVSRYKPLAEGSVRVNAIYSAGIDLLNQIKEAFESLHPGVKVIIEYIHPEEVYEAVREHRCDLGILSYPQRWQQVHVIPLRDEPMVVTCSLSHPLASNPSIHASDLQDWPMVTFEQSLPVGRSVRRYLREHHVHPNVTNVFDNIDTIKSAVAITEQLAILPQRAVLRELAAGTLAVIDLEPRLVRPMGIIYRRHNRKGLRPAVQAFIDYLHEHAGPNGDETPPTATSTTATEPANAATTTTGPVSGVTTATTTATESTTGTATEATTAITTEAGDMVGSRR